ncbi:MAG: type II secretion system protein [Acidiferrobacter sp.]
MKRQQAGFTLIELVVVIIILGILAAVALPKFMGLSSDARVSVVDGMGGSVSEAADMVHALAEVQGQVGATGAVTMPGTTTKLTTIYGYPDGSSTGIYAALQDAPVIPATSGSSGFPFVFTKGSPATFAYTPNGSSTPVSSTGCVVSYTPSSGAGVEPLVAVDTGSC